MDWFLFDRDLRHEKVNKLLLPTIFLKGNRPFHLESHLSIYFGFGCPLKPLAVNTLKNITSDYIKI